MARAQVTDFLHNMRFHVDVVNAGGADRLNLIPNGRPQAGFQSVSTPGVTVEGVEYKEGNNIYTKKYPGNPAMDDITLMRGVARGDSSFWDWLRVIIEGSGEYRADIQIKHYHRDSSLNREFPAQGIDNKTILNLDLPARVYHVKEAFPTRHKVAGDLDSTASDISIMEMDITYEHFEVEELRAP